MPPLFVSHGSPQVLIEDSEARDFLRGYAATFPTPRAIVMKLNAAVNRVLQSPDAIKRMQDLGLEVLGGTPESAEAFVKREAATVRQLLKQGKVRTE